MFGFPVSGRKVSSLETLEAELSLPSAEIAVKIEELETRGAFKGIMIDDARGRGGSGRSFVRVADDQMKTLAAVVRQRGRLTVADFAAEANRVLQLSDGGEEAKQTRQVAETKLMHTLHVGCEAEMRAPNDGCPKGEEGNESSANPTSSSDVVAPPL